jgi:transposase InsO family protein
LLRIELKWFILFRLKITNIPLVFLSFNFYQKDEANAINRFLVWYMSNNMKAKLVNDALTMAIWKRKPKRGGLIWHTDRGSQYASESHRSILKDHDIIQSMSRKGDCWDNAVAESFFKTLKTELTNHYQLNDQQEAKNVIFEYIEVFYNRIRTHSANNYLSPVEFERKNQDLAKSIKLAQI